MKKYTRGFTLIELLVVIAIIAILASIVLASLNQARTKSRDARRIADAKQVQLALELYNNDNASYPAATSSLVSTYISTFPNDPVGTSPNTYRYLQMYSGKSYIFQTVLENALTSGVTNGTTTNSGVITCGSTANSYCVTP